MARAFFNPTHDFYRQHAELFDFVHGTTAALWNMRWQVQGYLGVAPVAPEAELKGRFVIGSGVDRTLDRANVKASFVRTSWSRQQDELATVALVNLIALYEGWLDDVIAVFALTPTQAKKRASQLQFPSTPATTNAAGNQIPPGGVGPALAALRGGSPFMKTVYEPVLRSNQKYDRTSLEDLLRIYRYFKEVRNSFIHRGGRADQKTVDAWQALASVAATPKLVIPVHRQPVLDQVIRPTLLGVLQFGEIVLRLVVTLDAELAVSAAGEKNFIERWRKATGRKTVTRKQPKRAARLLALAKITGAPAPHASAVADLDAFLTAKQLIS